MKIFYIVGVFVAAVLLWSVWGYFSSKVDGRIQIVTIPEQKMAALRFSGMGAVCRLQRTLDPAMDGTA